MMIHNIFLNNNRFANILIQKNRQIDTMCLREKWMFSVVYVCLYYKKNFWISKHDTEQWNAYAECLNEYVYVCV